MLRCEPATRAVIALASVAPSVGLAIVGRTMVHGGWRPGVVYWLAALALLVVFQPVRALATRLEATLAGVAAVGYLSWVDPALTAVMAVPLVVGALANRRAAAARAVGMSAVAAVSDRVSTGTAQLMSAGGGERAKQEHLATVDRFHNVFSTHTRRVSTAAALAEIACSPVTIVATALTVGTVLMTPGVNVLAFLLLGPVVGDCAATLIRHQSPGVPPQFTTGAQASMRTTIERLRSAVGLGGDVTRALIAAIVTAVLHGASLALAISVVWSLLNQDSAPWPPLFSLPAVAIAHALALRWANGSAQVAGVAVLRQLSHRIVNRILLAPAGSLTGYEDQLPRLVTKDTVTISGLPVHAFRPFISAGLTPVTALLMIIMIDRQLAIPALLLLPLVALAIQWRLRQPRRHLRSALAATHRVLTFLSR